MSKNISACGVVHCGPLQSAVVCCGPLWCGAMINLLIRGSLQTGRQLGFKLGSNQLIRLPSMLCCSPMVLNSWQPPAVSQLRCPPPPPHLLHYRWTLERICLVQLVSKIISPLCNLSKCKTSVWTQWLMGLDEMKRVELMSLSHHSSALLRMKMRTEIPVSPEL